MDHVRLVVLIAVIVYEPVFLKRQHAVYLRFAMGWWRLTCRIRGKWGHELINILFLCPIFWGTKPWYSQLYLMCRNHRPMVDFVWFMVVHVPQRHHRGACLVPWWLRLHPRDDQWLVALFLQWSMISVSMIFMGYIRMTSPPKPRKPGLPATSLAYSLS